MIVAERWGPYDAHYKDEVGSWDTWGPHLIELNWEPM